MKMSAELYARCHSLIVDYLEARGMHTPCELWDKYRDAGLSHERFRWDLWHAACATDNGPNHAALYTENLSDNHIDTALRRITGA